MTPDTMAPSPAVTRDAPEGERPHPTPLLRYALEALNPSRASVAKALGVSAPALHSYVHGTRRPSPLTRRLVAAFLRAHAQHLETLAGALENELEQEG
jgi:transcriptional regulator with XRE-family HTH domain